MTLSVLYEIARGVSVRLHEQLLLTAPETKSQSVDVQVVYDRYSFRGMSCSGFVKL